MIRVGSLRFFLAVSPAPGWLRLAVSLAASLGVVTVWLSPAEIDSALGSVLLLQMFAASSGYRTSASRGFFDPLLVSGRPMWRIAAGHLAAAALPGLLAWTAIVLAVASLGHPSAAVSPQRHLAFVIVSGVAWSAGLRLPRMAAGVLWCFVMLAFAMSHAALAESLVWMQRAPHGLQTLVVSGMAIVCPFLLLSDFPAWTTSVLGLTTGATLSVVGSGWRYVCRREHPLVEPS